jgi:hypothetical protein
MPAVLKVEELRLQTHNHVISVIADGRIVVQFHEPRKMWVRVPGIAARVVLDYGAMIAVTEDEYNRR